MSDLERTHGQALYAYAYMLTGSRADAQDLVQDALVALLTRSRRSEVLNPVAYARRSIFNDVVTRTRRHKVLFRITPRLANPVDKPAADETWLVRDALWRDMSKLPVRQRAALVLRYYEDLPDREIAAALGCSEPTVRSLVSRGLSRLRVALTTTPEREDASHG